MKYIKTYESLNVGDIVKTELSSHINWRMIEDLKDMSLEYLDDGFYLEIFIVLESEDGTLHKIYTIVHTHNARRVINKWDIDKLSLGAIENISDDIKIIYNIILRKVSDRSMNQHRMKQLVSRASEAYPGENFETFGSNMKYLQ